jgi:2,4-dienoyl-CoA reductase-like NADH-dependent reductase (Old Yellow Enzyme family)
LAFGAFGQSCHRRCRLNNSRSHQCFSRRAYLSEDLGLWKDEQIEKLVQINQFIVSQHSVPNSIGACREKQAVLLLGMAIKTGCHRGGWETVAPSAIPFQDTDTMPVALDKSGIEK